MVNIYGIRQKSESLPYLGTLARNLQNFEQDKVEYHRYRDGVEKMIKKAKNEICKKFWGATAT